MVKSKTSFTPPDLTSVTVYFTILGLRPMYAEAFYLYYTSHNWMLENKAPVKNWKVLAYNWVASFSKGKPLNKKSIHC
ncbi:hypothetical protein SAMN05660909_02178 [Chitinophaga terrae (ex Kim and Jung 2007)]|uniref:Uncharacterized protein n=1 Tax=Chitinophaga terrae (ex Kim and Jung 2007) TaxID=408074 RepID=A0A1H4BMX2_9BACT|nr:hypothetical protein [Chitinophaga terrae (ex Kim and Jung 2007)]SEA49491.1 hypothetical protein SAMN05660909_02178 [Chitinophaga terrae (ex Kim and Jung 2007)]